MLEVNDTGSVQNGGGNDISQGGIEVADPTLKRDTGLLTADADENDNKTNTSKRIKSSPPETKTITLEIMKSINVNSSPPDATDGKPNQKLEVPSTQLKFIQKQVLIEKLMSSTGGAEGEESMEVETEAVSNGAVDSSTIVLPKTKLPKQSKGAPKPEQRKTFKMRSSLLDRVKSFLPEFRNANDELLRLPDPSKLSLESDHDEMDGRAPEPSSSGVGKNKTFVEMNLALVEQSDSDSSTDDESYRQNQVKGLPTIKRNSISPTKLLAEAASKGSQNTTAEVEAAVTETQTEEKKALITELN